jgi:hypothetical protein
MVPQYVVEKIKNKYINKWTNQLSG